MDGLTAQEREEQRKRNANRQRAYRERKLKQLEEARNQFAEQQKNQNVERQRQNSTNIPVEAIVEDAQCLTFRVQRVDERERKLNHLEEQRNINGDADLTVKERGVEMEDNISVPSKEMYTRHRKIREQIDRLTEVQMCHVFLESYARIKGRNTSIGPMCV